MKTWLLIALAGGGAYLLWRWYQAPIAGNGLTSEGYSTRRWTQEEVDADPKAFVAWINEERRKRAERNR